MKPTVLIIDDEEAIAWALRKACENQGYRAVVAPSAEEGLSKAKSERPAAIFLDVRLPGMDGLTALGQLRQLNPDAAILVMTAHGNLSTAVKAVEGGAFDYLAKPFDLDAAMGAVERAVKRGTKQAEVSGATVTDDEIIGASLAIQSVFKRIALVAPTNACVLITGESGTGKELVARAIHANSPRRDKPFLPVHVAALNPNLVESELFGHVKGAFTGADRSRPGLLALADGGTVFLDELGDIPLGVQVKLLRVLERQEILPVGGVESQRVNVRIDRPRMRICPRPWRTAASGPTSSTGSTSTQSTCRRCGIALKICPPWLRISWGSSVTSRCLCPPRHCGRSNRDRGRGMSEN